MPSKLHILAGYLQFCPHKISSFPFAAVSRGATVTALPPKFARLSEIPPHRKEDRRMSIPQRGIASVYAVHTAGALSVWSPANFRDGYRAKAVLTTSRNTPSGPAHEAQGRVCSPREIFSVNADRRRWQPVPSVATDCDVDLRVALPSIYPYR